MPEVPTLQLFAYASLTFAGVCIAAAALMFSYRQNYGWRPTLLVTNHGLEGIGGDSEYIATLHFEFWNRRKYPVVIRHAEVDFGALQLK
jgi:predicted alpha/beta-fold hydrolase